MSFVWPLAWALGALAIPITALYLIRTRLQRKPVSTFLFWEHLTPQVYNHSLWRKLRRWVSLALQLLFLLLLVTALSQPLASWQSLKPTSVILVMDASVSMTAAHRWSEAMEKTGRRIAQLRFLDEATVITAGETPRVLCAWTRNKRTLERALATAAPAATSGDIRTALALAQHLKEQRQNPEIFLVSDGVWEAAPSPEALQGVQTHWVGEPPVNAGLSLFTARRSLAAPGEYQLIARAVAAGEAPTTAELEIRRDGALIDVQPLRLEPGKPWQKTWDGTASGEVRFEARLNPTGGTPPRDDLAADNRAEARLAALHPVKVELVAPPNAFLDAALASLPMAEAHRTWPIEKLLGPGSQLPPELDTGKLYVFYRCLPPDGFHAQAMLLINPAADGFWGKANGSLDAALVSDSLRDEPILRFVSLDSLHLQKARDFTPAPGARVFAESFGKPLLFGYWPAAVGDGETRWLALSFGLEDSDLVFRTAFPILLGNLIQSLQPDETGASQPLPGAAESQLKALRPPAKPDAVAPLANRFAWWSAFPLWWWALGLGLLWLLAEWGLYSRRITE